MSKKYIHLYVWSCQLHTGGAYVIDTAVIQENEEWCPCACVGYSYIPVADFTPKYLPIRAYTDEICDKLNITPEQLTKLEVEAVKKAQKTLATASDTGWVFENLRAEIVRQIASGKIQVDERERSTTHV